MTLNDFTYSLPWERIARIPSLDNKKVLLCIPSQGTHLVINSTELFKFLPGGTLVLNGAEVAKTTFGATIHGQLISITAIAAVGLNEYICLTSLSKKIRVGSRIEIDSDYCAVVTGIQSNRHKTLIFPNGLPLQRNYLYPLWSAGKGNINPFFYFPSNTKTFSTVPPDSINLSRDFLLQADLSCGLEREYIEHHCTPAWSNTGDVTDVSAVETPTEFYKAFPYTRAIAGDLCSLIAVELAHQNGNQSVEGFYAPRMWENGKFEWCDGLITTFYPPKSHQLMTQCKYGGYGPVMKAYQIALQEKFKFLSFGDLLVILR